MKVDQTSGVDLLDASSLLYLIFLFFHAQSLAVLSTLHAHHHHSPLSSLAGVRPPPSQAYLRHRLRLPARLYLPRATPPGPGMPSLAEPCTSARTLVPTCMRPAPSSRIPGAPPIPAKLAPGHHAPARVLVFKLKNFGVCRNGQISENSAQDSIVLAGQKKS